MAKKSKGRTRSVCIFEDCGNYTKGRGWKVCKPHSSTAAMRSEIESLRLLTPEGAWEWRKHPELRRLFDVLARLQAEAVDPASNGTLGAALSKVKTAADQVERIANTRAPKPSGPVAHCGNDECDARDRAQKADAIYCGYCGNLMPGVELHTLSESDERPTVAPTASKPADPSSGTAEKAAAERQARIEGDRAALFQTYRESVESTH